MKINEKIKLENFEKKVREEIREDDISPSLVAKIYFEIIEKIKQDKSKGYIG